MEAHLREENQTPESRKYCYFGYKFESLCTNNSDEIVNPNIEYCGIFKCKLNSHRIILAAEIDCQQGDKFLELKTSKVIANDKMRRSFERYKLLKYWIQSFLVGTSTIVVGFHENGILKQIKKLETLKIPRMVKDYMWSANVCLNFADQVLNFLKMNVENGKQYDFEFKKPFREITLTKL